MDLNQFKTDKVKELEGIWETLDGDTRVKIARYGNPKMVAVYNKYPRVIRSRIESGLVDDEDTRAITSHVMAQSILLDWEKVLENGEEVPYTQENAKRILMEYEEFRKLIWEISQEAALFHAEDVSKTSKNLPKGSSGSSSST